ncbi:penicillin-binding protein 2 [Candidatus Dojkabacteria bacterium]|nr:penicillin-binding protein 2 [Candidatus Dojkabacteria bacterium]
MRNQVFSETKYKLFVFGFILFFILNLALLIRWQIFRHDMFVALANERIVDQSIPELRGEILAKDNTTLAYSEPRFDIIVYKTELEFAEKYEKQTREEFITKVSAVLELSDLEAQLEDGNDWTTIKYKIPYEAKEQVLNLKRDNDPDQNLLGLRVAYTSQRIYPEDTLACHLTGYLGKNDVGDSVGSAGLEHYWEGLLKEQEGFNLTEVDSFGNIIALDSVAQIEARRGAVIHTTIDKNIQAKIEKHIKAGVEKYDAKSGTVIVMDPKTGEILGLANYPNYDPNIYYEVENADNFKNVAISDPAELGSVGKVFTAAAALDQGVIQPDTVVIKGHSGCTTVKEEERDWEICTYDKKPRGGMTATEALVNSDNLALYEISKLIGPEKLYEYLSAFGIGTKTGIDISGESNGLFKDLDQWTNVDSATYSFGHGYQMTAIQAIRGVGAVANDGKLMTPYVVSEVEEANGKKRVYKPIVNGQPIKTSTAQKLKDMLYEVYKSNLDESRYKSLAKYNIAMKSGTATIPYKDRAGYSSDINATYIGFDASDEKTFIMLVKLEEPKAVERLSYYSARILWLDIFIDLKDYLGVPPVKG